MSTTPQPQRLTSPGLDPESPSPSLQSPGLASRDLTPEQLARALGVHTPTPEQSQVISHPLSPVLVVAGAGSGKTATMSQRVVYLVASGQVRPEQVLGLTFTRKATAELDQRVATRLSQLAASGLLEGQAQEAPEPTIATYNSFAGSIVRDHGLRIGAAPDSVLITEARAWQIASGLVESCTEPLPLDKAGSATSLVLRLDAALSENLLSVPQAQEQLADLEELFTALAGVRGLKSIIGKAPGNLRTQRQMLGLVQAYRDHKRRHNLLDFGDQVALACRVCEEVPEAVHALRAQYPAVLLDEFQDTSVAQLRLLSALFAGSGVTAVGDPNQAIYGWRGASAGALDTFHARFNPAGTAAVAAGGPAATHTPVLQLSTAWRNDRRILQAANVTSGPLRHHQPQAGDPRTEHIPVQELVERPAGTGLADGLVAGAFLQDPLQEAEHIARFLDERWGPTAQMAVLCRTREQLGPVAQALEAHGLPYEVVGLGGMLSVPEVADVRALLTVAADPERGDRLVRLLTGRQIGASDLQALHRLSRSLLRRTSHSPGWQPDSEEAEHPLLAEAVEHLTRLDEQEQPPTAPGLSEPGRRAAVALGRAVRRARRALGLPLPEQVVLAERALGLDIEVTARVGNPLGRRALDAFRATAEQFTADMEAPTLTGFLQWLDTAEEREAGFAAPEVEPEPGAVQVLTVHASKGLEWDTVCVCGLDEQVFPSYRAKPTDDLTLVTSGWMTSAEELPHPLRADADTLPPFTLGGMEPAAEQAADLKQELAVYREALGRHSLAEERRLAYVAFTRARHDLLLTGSHLAKGASSPRPVSRFLAELRRRELVTPYGDGWTEPDPQALNPLVASQATGTWPHETSPDTREGRLQQARLQAAQLVRQARTRPAETGPAGTPGTGLPEAGPLGTGLPDAGLSGAALPGSNRATVEAPAPAPRVARWCTEATPSGARRPGSGLTDTDAATAGAPAPDLRVARWCTEAALLLAERSQLAQEVPQVRLPAHLAATKVDDLRERPDELALALRRPLPPRPSPSSRLGTVFHEAVAQRLAAQAGLLSLQEAGAPPTLSPADRQQVESWLQVVESLPLLEGYVLAHTEKELETTLAGVTLRCRLDAVFKQVDGGGWLIVDWKTGRQEVPVEQLSVYVHAWARAQEVEPESVRAAYVYVAQAEPSRQVRELSAQQLVPLEELTRALSLSG
ncbi:ATP-dependent DNA helicase [Actinomyces weissii]|uniref:DNA 3'-5' helicase n=1 Tax=Actinomyces weissii TaxID=675090 RepID=A0A7T7M8H9_9ACTO|nr:ATP-dependent DNA helicase [Actinomyces weissii]QQM66873.1 ATP-dependent helicase [Actinomyces weissii]